jgi:hypothetical protein
MVAPFHEPLWMTRARSGALAALMKLCKEDYANDVPGESGLLTLLRRNDGFSGENATKVSLISTTDEPVSLDAFPENLSQ